MMSFKFIFRSSSIVYPVTFSAALFPNINWPFRLISRMISRVLWISLFKCSSVFEIFPSLFFIIYHIDND
jgi:hypothetical protein